MQGDIGTARIVINGTIEGGIWKLQKVQERCQSGRGYIHKHLKGLLILPVRRLLVALVRAVSLVG